MSIADKLTTIAENEPKVYEKGRQDERSDFWDNYPKGINIQYAFGYHCWNDVVYNPIQDIILLSYNYYTSFFYNSNITDTKVNIDVSNCNNEALNVFRSSKLKTIRKIIVSENITYSAWFAQCSKLENIAFEGVIGQNISFADSPLLTRDSIIGKPATEEQIVNSTNIIIFGSDAYYGGILAALKNIRETGETRTLTLHADAKARLTDEEIEIITNIKGWTLA